MSTLMTLQMLTIPCSLISKIQQSQLPTLYSISFSLLSFWAALYLKFKFQILKYYFPILFLSLYIPHT